MRFVKIEWKNIFAYGEEMQTIDYNDGELVLLKGDSGSGKSTIMALPSLLLYGKLEKLTKTSIANRINKNGFIRGTIIKNNHTYVIERGFTPNTLTVYKDGNNIDSYGVSSAQDYIDNEIADIPIHTFSNIISLSLRKFKSFLKMSPADRKEIVDRVFNLDIVNIMNDLIKKDVKSYSSAINSANASVFQLNQALQNAINEYNKALANAKRGDIQGEIDINTRKINESTLEINRLTQEYQTKNADTQKAYQELDEIKKKYAQITFEVKQIDEKINLFNQSKCPTCGTMFDAAIFTDVKNKLKTLKDNKITAANELKTAYDTLTKSYSELLSVCQGITNKISELKNSIYALTNLNNALGQQAAKTVECTTIQNIIDSTKEQIEKISAELSDNTAKMQDLNKLISLCGIDGVKQRVIANYIPLFNQEIHDGLEKLNFPYDLVFDSSFTPKLLELNTELSPETLSDGEETRADLVVMCALYKLLKRRFPSINILAIDEIISSLDTESSGLVLEYIKHFVTTNHLSCMIVSHTDLYLDNFDKIVEVKKNGFSRINIISTAR